MRANLPARKIQLFKESKVWAKRPLPVLEEEGAALAPLKPITTLQFPTSPSTTTTNATATSANRSPSSSPSPPPPIAPLPLPRRPPLLQPPQRHSQTDKRTVIDLTFLEDD